MDNFKLYNKNYLTMDFIKKLINGEFSLAKTFWLYGFIVIGALGCIGGGLLVYQMFYGLFAVILVGLIYFVIQSIGLWRASSKYCGLKIWSVLSKFWVILVALNYAQEFFLLIRHI